MKRHIITVIKFAMSIAILGYLFNKASQDDQFSNLIDGDKNWGWLAVALLATLLAHLIGFVRWRIMVRALELPFSWLDAIRIGFIGLFFNLFAFGVIGGDALRAFYVTKEIPDRKPEAIASVVADRLIGLLTMLLVASFAFLLFDTSELESSHPKKLATIQVACRMVMTLTFAGFAGLAVLLAAPSLTKTNWFQKVLGIPVLGTVIEKVLSVVMLYRSRPMVVAVSFLLSFGVNICFVLAIYSIAAAFFPTYPSFSNHFIIEPISMVSNAVPLPGGLGGMEYALDFLYQAFSSENGVVVAFGFRFSLLLISAIGAVIWFFNRSQVAGLAGLAGLIPAEDDEAAAKASEVKESADS